MEFDWFTQLHQIQVDITSHCNAKCGDCVRNVSGGITVPGLALNHFDYDIWCRLAKEDTRGVMITRMTLNGNWGDALMHPRIVDMIKVWLEYHPETEFVVATNASLRPAKFWNELGKVLPGPHKLEVAIDGLHDTHSIYRRNTDFDLISNNIRTFVNAGGYCQPIVTVFDHNKHQLDDIAEHCRNLGCQGIEYRVSHNDDIHVETPDEDYKITAPRDFERKEIVWKEFHYSSNNSEIGMKLESFTKCPWYNRAEIQIDPWHRVWPCCHISGLAEDFHGDNNPEKQIIAELLKKFNNLKDSTLMEICTNEWYSKTLPNNMHGKTPFNVCKGSCDVHLLDKASPSRNWEGEGDNNEMG